MLVGGKGSNYVCTGKVLVPLGGVNRGVNFTKYRPVQSMLTILSIVMGSMDSLAMLEQQGFSVYKQPRPHKSDSTVHCTRLYLAESHHSYT